MRFAGKTGDKRASSFSYYSQIKMGYKREAKKGSGDPGNSHSRAVNGTPCDFRRSACLFPAPLAAGSGPRRGLRGEAPNVPQIAKRSKKSSQGAKRYLTVGKRTARFYMRLVSVCILLKKQNTTTPDRGVRRRKSGSPLSGVVFPCMISISCFGRSD